MGATAKEKKVNMKIIAKDNLIPVIKAGVEKANVDDANLTIEATNSEVRYSMEFPSEVNRQNMLNCACAISFLNWRYGEKENPCYYTYDEKIMKSKNFLKLRHLHYVILISIIFITNNLINN